VTREGVAATRRLRPAFTLVSNDQGDWVGLYGPDGRLIEEGHSFSESRILELAGVAHDRVWDVNLDDLGRLPDSLGEVAALGGKLTAVRP
jgi:hypothetical protein